MTKQKTGFGPNVKRRPLSARALKLEPCKPYRVNPLNFFFRLDEKQNKGARSRRIRKHRWVYA